MKKEISLIAGLLFCLSLNAQASVLTVDDLVFGTGAITVDTDQGLEFLDLTVSTGLSFNDVSSNLGTGGTFEGFRYATSEEVITLFDNIGVTQGVVGGSATASFSDVALLASFVGLTGSFSSGEYIYGMVGSRGTATQTGWVEAYAQYFGPSLILDTGLLSKTYTNGHTGSYLVREAAVPEASSLSLLALGLVMLSASRRSSLRSRTAV